MPIPRVDPFRRLLRSLPALFLGVAFSAGSAWGDFSLALEVNPDPVAPGQPIDVQVSVSSTANSGTLTLNILWPALLETTPSVSDGGDCPGAFCEAGESLSWDLGSLGANSRVTISFSEFVRNTAVDGATVPLDIELLENGLQVATLSRSTEVLADSPLELAIDPLTDPVPSGGTLVYELVYGNTAGASSSNTELNMPLPVGTQFVSATGGGAFSAGSVTWSLGNLPPNTGGRERVTVQVGVLDEGTLLSLEGAVLSGEVSLIAREARATAVSSIASEALELELEVNPDPTDPDQNQETQVSIGNPTAGSTGPLSLRLLWPEELTTSPLASDGGDCPGSFCETGEYLVWDLGALGPNRSVTVSYSEFIRGTVADGTLIPLEFELLEAGSPARNLSHTAIAQGDSPLELVVDPLSDPVSPGAELVYEVVYGNTSAVTAQDAVLTLPLPEGTQFVSATGGGALSSGTVTWSLGDLPPHSAGRERLTVQAGALNEGSLLSVDAAVLAAEISFAPRHARAMAVSGVATETLELALEINPDPVDPNQIQDTQITVGNPDAGPTGTLSLRLLWPEELATSPLATDGGDCPGSFCDTGEYLSWDLGLLGGNRSVTVSFSEPARPDSIDGSLIPLEFELFEDGLPVRKLSHTTVVSSDSPLELAVDPLADPVQPGGTLVYELVYGNTDDSSLENAELSMPLPAGTQFVSATGDGLLSAGRVVWSLGSLAPSNTGRQRVTVQVDALAEGSLLTVDAAVLSGTIGPIAREARAMAVSGIATEVLELEIEVNPDPVKPGQNQDTQITVGNTGAGATGVLSLRLLWPEELATTPLASGGGDCPGSFCEAGEYLSWELGLLGGNSTVTVSFSEFVRGTVADGTLIPLEFELFEDGLPVRKVSHKAVVLSDSPLELALTPSLDPVPSGGTLVYELIYGNSGTVSARDTVLTMPVPEGTQFLSATGAGEFSEGSVSWSLGVLQPNVGGRERVTVQVGALADGALLSVDSAVLSGEVALLDREARASSVSRVAVETLGLTVDATPNPVLAGADLGVDITVDNPNAGTTGTLLLRLLWPEGLNTSPATTGGGDCPGSFCEAGEYLTWDLGLLGANADIAVSVVEPVRANAAEGTIIPLEFELFEDGKLVRSVAQSVLVNPSTDTDNDGEPDAFDDDDDGDGMSDRCEIRWGLDPLDPSDADEDPDGDGRTNRQECEDGTNPFDNDNFIFKDGFEADE